MKKSKGKRMEINKKCSDDIYIYKQMIPGITFEELDRCHALANDPAYISSLVCRAKDGDRDADSSLGYIILAGRGKELYEKYWSKNDEEEKSDVSLAVKDMFTAAEFNHDPLANACLNSGVAYLCHVCAAHDTSRIRNYVHRGVEVTDVANEQYAAFLQNRKKIAATSDPRTYLLSSLRKERRRMEFVENSPVEIITKACPKERKVFQKIYRIARMTDEKQREEELSECMSGDYERDYIYLRIYYMFLNGLTSLEEISFEENELLRYCTEIPLVKDDFHEFEEKEYIHQLIEQLLDPLMRLVISYTYLHPKSPGNTLVKTYEKKRSQAELEERYGISRELYEQMLKFAEQVLKYNMLKTGLYDYLE